MSSFFSSFMQGYLKRIEEQKWSDFWNGNSKKFIAAAQRASGYDDFLNKSGLNAKVKAYQAAVASAPVRTYYAGTDELWNGDRSRNTEQRKDLSGISQDLKDAYSYINSDRLKSQYTNIRNEYGTVTENADAGTESTGNTVGVGDSGNGAVANSSGGGRRQGGDMIAGDTARSNDSRGGDTLLGYSRRSFLKDKETLF